MVANNNRIFIVDDESDTCLALEKVLEENGFKVDKFTNPLLEFFIPNNGCPI
jgi:DNA-binding response OmpR family regulator